MTDVYRCWRCGVPSDPHAQFCSSCGQHLAAAPQPPAPVVQQPTPPTPQFVAPAPQFVAPAPQFVAPAPQFAQFAPPGAPIYYGPPLVPGAAPMLGGIASAPLAATGPRPFGILVLVIAMALTSVIDLWVMWVDFGYWSIWNFGNDYFSQGVVDGAWALVYLAVSVFGFLAASRLWAYERSGWLIANAVAFAWLALDYLGMLLWPPTTLGMVGLVGIVAILIGLNLNYIRAIFGRPPLLISRTPGHN